MLRKWQAFFLDRMADSLFIPLVEDMEKCITLDAHTTLDKYIDFYCFGGAGGFWAVLSMLLQPKVIVEFGTANGATANLLAKLNPHATIYTVDHIELAGTADAPTGFLATADNIKLVIGDSNNFACENVDMCFIDANHSHSAVKADSSRAWKNRNEKGEWIIVWDDQYLESVKTAVDFFVNKVRWELQSAMGRIYVGPTKSEDLSNLRKEKVS